MSLRNLFLLMLGFWGMASAMTLTSENYYNDPFLLEAVKGISCNDCKFLVETAQYFAKDARRLSDLKTVLEAICDTLEPSKVGTCKLLVGVMTYALPLIDKGLTDLAWDVPEGVCSSFIPVCKIECCDHPTAPEQIHLALTGNDFSTMSVSWATLQSTKNSTVRWRADNSTVYSTTNGQQSTYTVGGWVGVLHTAVMTNLRRGQKYFYSVGDSIGGFSPEYAFYTLPTNVGTPSRPLRVIQIGDMGYCPESDQTVQSVLNRVNRNEVDMIMHIGDISYADGYMRHWDVFMRKIQPIATQVPYMVTSGNHEFWFNFTAYKNRWSAMPLATLHGHNVDNKASFYSLNIGPMHLTMIDTETPFLIADISPIQQEWIQQDLATANRNRTQQPWLVVAGHRPFYCTNGGFSGSNKDCKLMADILKSKAEDIIYDNEVDLVITAHMHGYERTYPVYKNSLVGTSYHQANAPIYVVQGAGGSRQGYYRPVGDAPWSVPNAVHSTFGYAVMEITGKDPTTGLARFNYKFIRSEDDAILDEFEVTK